jgi:UDPglucose 6-dehydrogenase
LCDGLNININDVSTGIGLDKRIGPQFLRAGMGYGGSCFPKDVNALIQMAKENGQPLSILEHVVKVNEEQPVFFIEKIKQALGGNLLNKKIAVLGLSFKANTDDTRESPSLILIDRLLAEQAQVKVHDPIVKMVAAGGPLVQFQTISETVSEGRGQLTQFQTILEAVTGADALVIGTDWDEYKNLDWASLKSLMTQPYIFDGRNMLDKEVVENLGFHYIGVANQ